MQYVWAIKKVCVGSLPVLLSMFRLKQSVLDMRSYGMVVYMGLPFFVCGII